MSWLTEVKPEWEDPLNASGGHFQVQPMSCKFLRFCRPLSPPKCAILIYFTFIFDWSPQSTQKGCCIFAVPKKLAPGTVEAKCWGSTDRWILEQHSSGYGLSLSFRSFSWTLKKSYTNHMKNPSDPGGGHHSCYRLVAPSILTTWLRESDSLSDWWAWLKGGLGSDMLYVPIPFLRMIDV